MAICLEERTSGKAMKYCVLCNTEHVENTNQCPCGCYLFSGKKAITLNVNEDSLEQPSKEPLASIEVMGKRPIVGGTDAAITIKGKDHSLAAKLLTSKSPLSVERVILISCLLGTGILSVIGLLIVNEFLGAFCIAALHATLITIISKAKR